MKLKKLIKLNDIFYFRKHIYINLINRYRSQNLTKNRLNFLKNYDKKQLRFYFNCFVNFYIKFNFYNKSLFLHENFIFKLNFFFDFNYKDLLLIILKSDLKKYFYEIIFYKNFIFFNLFLIFKKLNLCFRRYCDFLEQNNLYFQIKEKIILKKIYYRNYSIYYYKNLMGFYNNKYYNFDNIFHGYDLLEIKNKIIILKFYFLFLINHFFMLFFSLLFNNFFFIIFYDQFKTN